MICVLSRRVGAVVATLCAVLALSSCASGDAPKVDKGKGSDPRSVVISVLTPVEERIPFTVEDATGELSETLAIEPGHRLVSVEVPETVPDGAEFMVTYDASTKLENYSLEGEAEQKKTFPKGSPKLHFYYEFVDLKAAEAEKAREQDAAEAAAKAEAAEAAKRVTWHMVSEKGYSFDLTAKVLPAVGDGKPDGEHEVGAACSFDKKRDIAIPVDITAVAATEDFDTPIPVNMTLVKSKDYEGVGLAPSNSDDRIRVEHYYSSGPNCEESSSLPHYPNRGPIGVSWDTPVKYEESRSATFVIIVKDFYTPNTPKGDWEYLDALEIRAETSGTSNKQTGAFVPNDASQFDRVGKYGVRLSGEVVHAESQ